MKLLLSKSATYICKSKDQRGSVGNVKVGYIKRVVTGKDKDGSPQYRYLRTQEEVEAYNKSKKSDKKSDTGDRVKEKTGKEHAKHVSLLVDKKKNKEDDEEESDKKVKKGLYLNVH